VGRRNGDYKHTVKGNKLEGDSLNEQYLSELRRRILEDWERTEEKAVMGKLTQNAVKASSCTTVEKHPNSSALVLG